MTSLSGALKAYQSQSQQNNPNHPRINAPTTGVCADSVVLERQHSNVSKGGQGAGKKKQHNNHVRNHNRTMNKQKDQTRKTSSSTRNHRRRKSNYRKDGGVKRSSFTSEHNNDVSDV